MDFTWNKCLLVIFLWQIENKGGKWCPPNPRERRNEWERGLGALFLNPLFDLPPSDTRIIWSADPGSSRSGVIRRILRSEPRILRSEVGAGSGSDHRINLGRIRITDPDLNFRSCRSRIRIRILKYGSDPDADPDLTVFVVDPKILNTYACAVFSPWKNNLHPKR